MQMYNIVLLRTSVNLRFFVPNHSIISCTSHSVFLFIHMLLVCCLFFRLHDLYKQFIHISFHRLVINTLALSSSSIFFINFSLF